MTPQISALKSFAIFTGKRLRLSLLLRFSVLSLCVGLECGALRDLLPFVQFKEREKHPWRSVNFRKVAGLNLTLLHGCFSRFVNCTNGTKLRNVSHIIIS